jgi:hypothetical protein
MAAAAVGLQKSAFWNRSEEAPTDEADGTV